MNFLKVEDLKYFKILEDNNSPEYKALLSYIAELFLHKIDNWSVHDYIVEICPEMIDNFGSLDFTFSLKELSSNRKRIRLLSKAFNTKNSDYTMQMEINFNIFGDSGNLMSVYGWQYGTIRFIVKDSKGKKCDKSKAQFVFILPAAGIEIVPLFVPDSSGDIANRYNKFGSISHYDLTHFFNRRFNPSGINVTRNLKKVLKKYSITKQTRDAVLAIYS
jgi:hypothetical protein